MQEGYVHSITEENVTTITFFHPAQNSLPGHLLKELQKSISDAGANQESILIVLRSDGNRSFCAGASFTELAAISNEEEGKTFFSGFAGVINAMRTCPKPVIGLIQGKAVGGGVGLAAACDYCLAVDSASFRLSELAVGIGPFVIGPVVERKVGLTAFSQMAITPGVWQSARWGYERGLYNQVVESPEALTQALQVILADLRTKSPEALVALKKIFWEGTENWDTLLAERAALSGRLILSDYAKKAIQDFLNT
jgi:methylglutaconyl-CoA hydratase